MMPLRNGWLERLARILSRPRVTPPAPDSNKASRPGFAPGRREDRPLVTDRKGIRQLYFDKRHIQSAMRLDDPVALVLPYTRLMMAFLLFVPDPSEILIVGLGGGSLAKFCHRHRPRARITAVEINPQVIALRRRFEVPEDERLVIVQADALEYLLQPGKSFDAILLDGFDADGIAPSLSDPRFYPAAARRLRPSGVLVSNLIGDRRRWHGHLNQMWSAFDRRVRVVPIPLEEDQYIALAFHDPALYRVPGDLERTARRLKTEMPLDFPRLAQWLERGDGTIG